MNRTIIHGQRYGKSLLAQQMGELQTELRTKIESGAVIRKVCDAPQIKMAESGHGSFTGYGSVFNVVDRVGEMVAPGAFGNLDAFVKEGFSAVGHDLYSLPVATIMSAKQDDYGLLITAEFHSTTAAQDARTVVSERLARGKAVGLSIGYLVKDYEATKDYLLLKLIELVEISIVTYPACREAGVSGSKSGSVAGSANLAAWARFEEICSGFNGVRIGGE